MQVGPVPVLVSVFYRFALASVVLVAALVATRRLEAPALRHQPWLIAQALCLFSFNFICFYTAEATVTSGLVSVIFSLATIYNAVNARLFFGDRITVRTVVAALMGAGGLVLLFGRDVWIDLDPRALKGIGLAALGTLFFSLGNMVSRRNSAAGLSPVTTNAWGMAYGAVILLALIAATGTPIVAPPGGKYLVALVYLAVFGSVIAFTTYSRAGGAARLVARRVRNGAFSDRRPRAVDRVRGISLDARQRLRAGALPDWKRGDVLSQAARVNRAPPRPPKISAFWPRRPIDGSRIPLWRRELRAPRRA